MSLTFPARFMLAAAMNPCPCGYFNDRTRECHCTPPVIQRYVSKISGPLLDRIDIHIDVPAVKYKELRAPSFGGGFRSRAAARDRRARPAARAIQRREEDLRKRADDAEDDSKALCNLGGRRKAAGKRDHQARPFRACTRPHPESRAHHR